MHSLRRAAARAIGTPLAWNASRAQSTLAPLARPLPLRTSAKSLTWQSMLRASRTYASDQSQEVNAREVEAQETEAGLEEKENEHLEALSSEEPQSSSEQPPIDPVTDADHPEETEQLKQEDSEAAQPNAGDNSPFRHAYQVGPSFPPSKTIYVGNVDFRTTSADLGERCGAFGKVANINMVTDARGLSKGFSFVELDSVDAAEKAIQGMHRTQLMGRTLSVHFAKGETLSARSDYVPKPPSKTLFIGNVPFQMSDQDLSNMFRDIKNVLDVRVAIDRRTGQPRGFAHADFLDIASAEEAAAKLKGVQYYGRTLRIDFSHGTSRLQQQP